MAFELSALVAVHERVRPGAVSLAVEVERGAEAGGAVAVAEGEEVLEVGREDGEGAGDGRFCAEFGCGAAAAGFGGGGCGWWVFHG